MSVTVSKTQPRDAETPPKPNKKQMRPVRRQRSTCKLGFEITRRCCQLSENSSFSDKDENLKYRVSQN